MCMYCFDELARFLVLRGRSGDQFLAANGGDRGLLFDVYRANPNPNP